MLLVSQSLIGSYIVASERVCVGVWVCVARFGLGGGRRGGGGSSFVEKLRASAARRLSLCLSLSRASFLMINCYFDPARLSPPCGLLLTAGRQWIS